MIAAGVPPSHAGHTRAAGSCRTPQHVTVRRACPHLPATPTYNGGTNLTTRTLTVPTGDVALHISIEDAQALRTAATVAQAMDIPTGDADRLRVLAPYLSLAIEQTIRGGGNDEAIDSVMLRAEGDILPNLRDPWAGGVTTSRERVFDATEQDPT